MTLQQFIEAKQAEWRKKFLTPTGFIRAAIKGSFQVTREQHEDFLATALREAATNTCEAVRVNKQIVQYDFSDALGSMHRKDVLGFNTAIEIQEKKINDYLK